MFLSKGMLFKKHSKTRLIIQKQGGRYELNGKKAHIWWLARDSFFIPSGLEEKNAVFQLCNDGLMVELDERNPYGEYDILAKNILCVNRRKRLRLPLRGVEREIMRWLQDGRRRLRMEELVYLVEHRVSPVEYETDEFGVALSERIYKTRVQVGNTLRRDMAYARRRAEVVNAVLRLFRKNRMYLI